MLEHVVELGILRPSYPWTMLSSNVLSLAIIVFLTAIGHNPPALGALH